MPTHPLFPSHTRTRPRPPYPTNPRRGSKRPGLSPVESITPQMVGLVCACLGAMLGGIFGGTIRGFKINGYW